MLYYYVFSSSNKRISVLTQPSSNPEFGNISDSLAAGTYHVIFIAGQSGLNVFNPTDYSELYFTYGPANSIYSGWKDTFFKQFTLTVTGATAVQTVALERVVSRIDLNITDAIPANVKTIALYLSNEYSGYQVNPEQPIHPFVAAYGFSIPTSAIGTTNYKLGVMIANTITPISVNIVSYDAAKNVITTNTIPGVTCQKNKGTLLSGDLFNINATGFHLSIDTTWDAAPITTHF